MCVADNEWCLTYASSCDVELVLHTDVTGAPLHALLAGTLAGPLLTLQPVRALGVTLAR